jgi:hypothetical protein
MLTDGFRMAGRLIADELSTNDFWFDYLFVPCVYLYRHSLELHLKHLRSEARRFLREEDPEERGHQLSNLWDQTAQLVERYRYRLDASTMADVSKRIAELDKLDPQSTNFRYPAGREKLGEFSLSVTTIADVMDAVLGYLDGVTTGLGERIQAETDGVD